MRNYENQLHETLTSIAELANSAINVDEQSTSKDETDNQEFPQNPQLS
jgi:hypothetical protein